MEINLDEVRAVGEEHYPVLAAAYADAATKIANLQLDIPGWSFRKFKVQKAMELYLQALGDALLPSAANLKACGEALVHVVEQLESTDGEVAYEFDKIVTIGPDLPYEPLCAIDD